MGVQDMTDDLVRRLRDKWQHSEDDCYEAANRIEELEGVLRSYACSCATDVHEDCEMESWDNELCGKRATEALGKKK